MSARVILECDGCGCTIDPRVGENKRAAREEAEYLGWRSFPKELPANDRKRDYCGECSRIRASHSLVPHSKETPCRP